MNKKLLLFAAATMLSAAQLCAYDVKAPGNIPVKFQKAPDHAPLKMVENGKINFVIAADLQAEARMKGKCRAAESIAPAIEIIQEALEHCVGQKAEVVDIAKLPKGKLAIVVGDNAVTRANGIDPSKMAPQELAVKTFAGGIIVAGHDSSLVEGYNMDPLDRIDASIGTRYAAYDFVERFLGVRYFFPGEYGTLWPKVKDLTITPVSYTDKPYFLSRGGQWYLSYCTTGTPKGKKFWEPYLGKLTAKDDRFFEYWRPGNTIAGGGTHCPRPERMAKSYPDKLKTIFYTSPAGNFYYNPHAHVGNYFDVTNLEFADLLIEGLKEFYASKGKIDRGGYLHQCCNNTYVSFGMCDTLMQDSDVVNDPTVKKLGLITQKDIDRGKNASMANVYARFHQYLANRIAKEFPGKKLYIMAYYNVQYAGNDPRWILPPNTEVNLCLGDLPNYTRNKEKMARAVQIAREWYVSLGNRPVQRLWLYQGTNPFTNAVSGEFICEIPKIMGKYLGNQCLFFDHCMAAPGDTWFFYPAVYAGYRSMWSPEWDVDAGLDEHWEPFYGKETGKYLKEFHHLVKDCFLKYGVKLSYQGDPLNYPMTDLNKMEELLSKAEQSVKKGSVEEKRLKVFMQPWPKAISSMKNQLSYERPVHNVTQLLSKEKAVIDGKADEAFWKRAKSIPLMDPKGSPAPLKYPATIKLAWNKDGIYGYCETTYPVSADAKTDLWGNDNYEFHFSPGLKKEEVCQFVFDGSGKQFLGYKRHLPIPQPFNAFWKAPGFKHVSIVKDDRWQVEFFIPFSVFQLATPVKTYDVWLANAVRNKAKDEKEYSGSSMTLGNNHKIEMYGMIKFAGKGE